MQNCFFLDRTKAGLFVVDVQEKLYPEMEHGCEMLEGMCKLLQGIRALNLPIVVTEQYPARLGSTLKPLLELLPEKQKIFSKTSFSSLREPVIKEMIVKSPVEQWILMGIEAHVCILQTAKDLVLLGKKVVVANDAITSRSIYDYSTAISEMKEWARVASLETILFELIGDSKTPEFKACLDLFRKEKRGGCCCG